MYLYGGENKFTLATPVANREEIELEPLMGFLVNTLAVPVEVDENLSLTEFTQHFANKFDRAFEHRQLPFELVQGVMRKAGIQESLFSSMFSLEAVPKTEIQFDECVFSLASYQKHNSKFPISLTILRHQDKNLRIRFTYKEDCFSEEFIGQLSKAYLGLLDQYLNDSSIRVSQLEILSGAEKKRIKKLGQSIPSMTIAQESIYQRFCEQVSLRPQKRALLYQNSEFSYHGLMCAADSLANEIRAEGLADSDSLVIYMARSPEVAVAMLACAKLGIPFIPVNHLWPKGQVERLVNELNPGAFLTRPEHTFDHDQIKNLRVSLSATTEVETPTENSKTFLDPGEKTLFIIYSSGTTGEPKASQISQQNFIDFFR